MNKNSDPGAEIFSLGVAGKQCPQLKVFRTSGIVRNESSYRKLIFGLHVNMDKANSHRYDVTRYIVWRVQFPPSLISALPVYL